MLFPRLLAAFRLRSTSFLSTLSHVGCTSSPLRSHLSPLSRALVALGAAGVALADPARGDMVALVGELTGHRALARLHARMLAQRGGEGRSEGDTGGGSAGGGGGANGGGNGNGSDDSAAAAVAAGARILRERPRLRLSAAEAEEALSRMPERSLGRAYGAFLRAHGFSPLERGEARLLRDGDLRYVLQRYREVHDLWHVLAGVPPTVLGETALKWLEMAHMGLPVAALAALAAPSRLRPAERSVLVGTLAPWAARCGRDAQVLLGVHYERLLREDLDEVRRLLRFEPAPAVKWGAP